MKVGRDEMFQLILECNMSFLPRVQNPKELCTTQEPTATRPSIRADASYRSSSSKGITASNQIPRLWILRIIAYLEFLGYTRIDRQTYYYIKSKVIDSKVLVVLSKSSLILILKLNSY